MIQRLIHFLFYPIDPSVVSIYRIVFGFFMVYQMLYYFQLDYAYQFMAGPEVLFSYEGFEFIQPVSSPILKGIHVGLLLSAVLIMLGLWYRPATIFFCIGFSYFSFIDKTLYNNHTYLIALIAFVFIFVQADRKYSLKAIWQKGNKPVEIPAWNQYILIFLIALPYFFGGIAKLSPNWLNTDLVPILVSESTGSFISELFSDAKLVGLVKYGGLVYDLLIVFVLLYPRTRWLGVILVVVFNLTNHTLLFKDIGLFPFLMICSTVLFFDASKVGKFFDAILSRKRKERIEAKKGCDKNKTKRSRAEQKAYLAAQREVVSCEDVPEAPFLITTRHKLTFSLLLIFFLFHVLFPLRHLLITENPEWAGRATRFAWRMKMQTREVSTFEMTFVDRKTGDYGPIDVRSFLSANQQLHISEDPDYLVRLAKYLHEKIARETGLVDPLIRADLQVRFNGLPNQAMFSKELDLVRIPDDAIYGETWIEPLEKIENKDI